MSGHEEQFALAACPLFLRGGGGGGGSPRAWREGEGIEAPSTQSSSLYCSAPRAHAFRQTSSRSLRCSGGRSSEQVTPQAPRRLGSPAHSNSLPIVHPLTLPFPPQLPGAPRERARGRAHLRGQDRGGRVRHRHGAPRQAARHLHEPSQGALQPKVQGPQGRVWRRRSHGACVWTVSLSLSLSGCAVCCVQSVSLCASLLCFEGCRR